MALDDFPESRDHPIAAVALWRAEQYMRTLGEWQQTRDEHGIDMEQRQPAEDGLAAANAVTQELRGAPGIGHLATVGAHRDLRQAGGASGAEAGRDILPPDLASAQQAVTRLPRQRGIEVVKLDVSGHRSPHTPRTTEAPGFAILQEASRQVAQPAHTVRQIDEHDETQRWEPVKP